MHSGLRIQDRERFVTSRGPAASSVVSVRRKRLNTEFTESVRALRVQIFGNREATEDLIGLRPQAALSAGFFLRPLPIVILLFRAPAKLRAFFFAGKLTFRR